LGGGGYYKKYLKKIVGGGGGGGGGGGEKRLSKKEFSRGDNFTMRDCLFQNSFLKTRVRDDKR
jgi:hypothetical protein